MAVDVQEALPGMREPTLAGRVETALEAAVGRALASTTPPLLASAIRHAVFPGGARIRPQLCLLVAMSAGDGEHADCAAGAIELLHCASLVHDDLPCFDDAETRRGQPSVHKAFGEAIAVLVGDALIVHAFAELAQGRHAPAMVRTLAQSAGAACGIVAGQAWESEPKGTSLDDYHRAKTGSLFEAAAALGAICAGVPSDPWRAFGDALGRAYQAADDVLDVVGDAETLGKPCGRDVALGRPSLVRVGGLEAAQTRARVLFHASIAAIPHGNPRVEAWVRRLAEKVIGI